MDNEEREKKKISVSVDPDVSSPQTYHFFLVQTTEDALRIDLAETEENTDEIKVNVKESISISADAMLKFAFDIVNELITYEEKYHNNKGLSLPE